MLRWVCLVYLAFYIPWQNANFFFYLGPATSKEEEKPKKTSDQTPKLPPIFPNKPLIQTTEAEDSPEPEKPTTTVEKIVPENEGEAMNEDSATGDNHCH